MARTKEDVLRDIREHPDSHRQHTLAALEACANINGKLDFDLYNAHFSGLSAAKQEGM